MQEGGWKEEGGGSDWSDSPNAHYAIGHSNVPSPRLGEEPGEIRRGAPGKEQGDRETERRADDQLYRQVEYERQREVIATPATWTLFLQSMKRVVELISLPLVSLSFL